MSVVIMICDYYCVITIIQEHIMNKEAFPIDNVVLLASVFLHCAVAKHPIQTGDFFRISCLEI